MNPSKTSRKKLLLLAALVTLFIAPIIYTGCAPSTTPAFISQGLVAYFPFNGNAHDSIDSSNSGQVFGATPCANRFGKANFALNFNGTDNYVSFKRIPLNNQFDNWTLAAWINPASLHQYSMAVCLGFDDGKTGDGYEFGMTDNNYYPGNNMTAVLGGVVWIYSGYTFESPKKWYQIVMLRRNGVTRLYVNGVETPNWETRTPLAPTAFTIGSGSGVRFFNGMIDDVRIYNRALSDTEVQQLYSFESERAIN